MFAAEDDRDVTLLAVDKREAIFSHLRRHRRFGGSFAASSSESNEISGGNGTGAPLQGRFNHSYLTFVRHSDRKKSAEAERGSYVVISTPAFTTKFPLIKKLRTGLSRIIHVFQYRVGLKALHFL